MLKLAVLIFAIGAVGGLVLANSVLRGRLAPWVLSLLHAALGATGLVLAGMVVLNRAPEGRGIIPFALLILVIAALGGFFLAAYHARKASPPRPFVFVHAGAAIIGFLLLAGGAFSLI